MTRDADLATDDLAVLYVLGELSPEEQTAFEGRLAADAELAAEVGRLRNTFDLLPYGSVTPPPAGLRDRVIAAAVAEAGPAPAAPVRTEPAKVVPFPAARPAKRVVWSRFAAAAAAALALALGIDGWRVRRELSLQRDVTALLTEPNVVRTFDLSGSGAFARVSLDMDAKKGALVAHDLPALPEGKVYRLWAAVGDKSVECGQFKAAADGITRTQFVVPVESYTAPIGKLFVTVEPSAPTPAPTGPTVMES